MNFSDIELPSYQHSDPEALMNSEVGRWRVNISTVEHIGPVQRKIFDILNAISGLRVNWWGNTTDVSVSFKDTVDRLLNYWIPEFCELIPDCYTPELSVISYSTGRNPIILNLDKLHDKIGSRTYKLKINQAVLSVICPDIPPSDDRRIEFNTCRINSVIGSPDAGILFVNCAY